MHVFFWDPNPHPSSLLISSHIRPKQASLRRISIVLTEHSPVTLSLWDTESSVCFLPPSFLTHPLVTIFDRSPQCPPLLLSILSIGILGEFVTVYSRVPYHRVCMHEWLNVCVYVCMYARMHAYMIASMHIYVCTNINVHVRVRARVHAYVCACMCTCTCVHVRVCLRLICACVRARVRVYTYIWGGCD